ncbi:MAG TPA: branched-chain amino acid ABC transporter permease [Candidatus Methylomirabilis sp.]|nr:branched-chain amino acid ABC transporter permease [Candidatus Methylomirabilis sp.]
MSGRRVAPLLACLSALLLLAVAPALVSPFLVQFLINLFMLAILAESWNIIGGFTGYASFGNVAFFGIGAYTTGVLLVRLGLPFALALPMGGLLAMLFAAVIGMPILRLKGHYFGIATLGIAETMREIVYNLEITGAGTGLTLPIVRSALPFFYIMLGILVAATLVNWWLSASRFGYGLVAIREDEDAAASMGINTPLYKTIAFSLSGAFAGLAGGVYAYWITFIDPEAVFKVTTTIQMIIMAVFGGTGTVTGPLLGALALASASEWLSTHLITLAELFNGLIIILVVLFMPKGLSDLIRQRPFRLRYFIRNLREYRI